MGVIYGVGLVIYMRGSSGAGCYEHYRRMSVAAIVDTSGWLCNVNASIRGVVCESDCG